CLLRQAGGFIDVVRHWQLADRKRLGDAGHDADGPCVAQINPSCGDRARLIEPHLNSDANDGIVAYLALQLLIRAAGSVSRYRYADLGKQLRWLQRRREDRNVQLLYRNDALTFWTRGHDLRIGREQRCRP